MSDKLFTLREAADWLGYSEEHTRRLARAGRLPALKVGAFWRFVPERLMAWVDAGCPDMSQQASLFDQGNG